MTAKKIPEVLDRTNRYGGRCTGCQRWIYAQTRKQWQRATRAPCPHCGKKGW